MATLGLTSLSSLSNFIVIQKCFFSVTVCSLNIVFFKISFMKIPVKGLPGRLFLRYITKISSIWIKPNKSKKKRKKKRSWTRKLWNCDICINFSASSRRVHFIFMKFSMNFSLPFPRYYYSHTWWLNTPGTGKKCIS